MAKPKTRKYSRQAHTGTTLLGELIHSARIKRKMTAAELAERAGVSRGLVSRVESGDMGVSIGAAFEMAVILGVPLFDTDPERVAQHLEQARSVNALLPKRAFQSTVAFDDNF